ncbi:MAG: ABC transporter permease [Sciscionella sp.]
MNIFSQLVAWFTDPAQWSGSGGIPVRVAQHVEYSAAAAAAALVLALPVGIGVGHFNRGGLLAINIANIGRAIPSLGLLVLMFFLVGFGFLPAFVALVALAIPPIVTNSYTGMRSVDPEVRESAIGMGMTRWQRLWQVEIPVAMPLILAGVRTSVVQVVATTTLAAFIGLGGLGRYLIDGLSQQDYPQVIGGAILVALLAIIVEFLMGLLQKLLVPRGIASRNATGSTKDARKPALAVTTIDEGNTL